MPRRESRLAEGMGAGLERSMLNVCVWKGRSGRVEGDRFFGVVGMVSLAVVERAIQTLEISRD